MFIAKVAYIVCAVLAIICATLWFDTARHVHGFAHGVYFLLGLISVVAGVTLGMTGVQL
jgi:hypothetical protein